MKSLVALLTIFFSACAYAQNTNIQLQQVAIGFSSPVLVTNARDGSNRLFIV
jgi:hypothetical protein